MTFWKMLETFFGAIPVIWNTNIIALFTISLLLYGLHQWYRFQKIDANPNNTYVLITGCDTGFGNRTAIKLDQKGFNVFAACLTEEKVLELTSQCSDRMMAFMMDVRNNSEIIKAVKFVKSRLPEKRGLWAVVNNAGIVGSAGVCEWLCKEEFKSTIEVNFLGTVLVNKAFLPLVKSCKGRIINMASTVGRFATPPAPYSVSKFCVEAYTDCLRRDLRGSGVSVHTIEPGGYRTNVTNASLHMTTLDAIFSKLEPSIKRYYGESYKDRFGFLLSFGSYLLGTNNLDEVTNVYVSVITARHPKTRYVVGLNGNFCIRPLWTLPTWLTDCLIGRAYPRPQGFRNGQ